jgi:hypothetical protein
MRGQYPGRRRPMTAIRIKVRIDSHLDGALLYCFAVID